MNLKTATTALAGLVTLLPVASLAAPLEPAACEQLRQELGALEKSGVRNNFAKGPVWAKANLKPDQLQQIEKLIETEAQFLFRCPQPKREFDPATEALLERGTGSDPDPDAKPAAPASPAAVAATAPKPKPKPKPTTTAATPSAGDQPAVETPPPLAPKKAAPKPKPVDALVPEPKKPAVPAQ